MGERRELDRRRVVFVDFDRVRNVPLRPTIVTFLLNSAGTGVTMIKPFNVDSFWHQQSFEVVHPGG